MTANERDVEEIKNIRHNMGLMRSEMCRYTAILDGKFSQTRALFKSSLCEYEEERQRLLIPVSHLSHAETQTEENIISAASAFCSCNCHRSCKPASHQTINPIPIAENTSCGTQTEDVTLNAITQRYGIFCDSNASEEYVSTDENKKQDLNENDKSCPLCSNSRSIACRNCSEENLNSCGQRQDIHAKQPNQINTNATGESNSSENICSCKNTSRCSLKNSRQADATNSNSFWNCRGLNGIIQCFLVVLLCIFVCADPPGSFTSAFSDINFRGYLSLSVSYPDGPPPL